MAEATTGATSQRGRERAWEVFARHGREPALHHVGEVQAATSDDATVFAYTLYDERRWAEMFVVEATYVTVLQSPE
ncbi:hypothetical protein [Salsipaludibacter albus]|uniref:hypothetical protein n=1 Tax=Salsipaludibacter albus TaxID=2849650 RepID=UPI001EE4ABCE|nr:hypothetical protein [Salsipaludibacter albus]MBY5163239.1 hypothetical protein [Salsipaludibacter albus]